MVVACMSEAWDAKELGCHLSGDRRCMVVADVRELLSWGLCEIDQRELWIRG